MSRARTPDESRFASLFVSLTGRSTIEEPQEDAIDHAVSDPDAEVGRYLAETARQTGLDDAIDASEDY